MRAETRKSILWGLLVVSLVIGVSTYLWEEVQYQTQLSDLEQFCLAIRTKTSLDEVRDRVDTTQDLRMVLLGATPEGVQIGSIYFEGSGPWACSVTFARGQLTKRSYGSGNLARPQSGPKVKLKPW